MSEVSFAKSILATLDKRAIKLPPDHVGDPRKLPNQSPYILPKNSHPFPKRDTPTSTQLAKEQTVTVSLKPMRGGSAVKLNDATLNTTIHDLKAHYSQETSQSQDKIKLLLNKKPAADLKTLKELGVDSDVEISVMIMGGTAATPSASSPVMEKTEPAMPAAAPVPEGDRMDIDAPAPESEKAQAEADAAASAANSAAGILQTEEFWSDLKGFLAQRLRDEKEGERLAEVFKGAWEKR